MKRASYPWGGGLPHPRWAAGGNLVISCGDHTDRVPGTIAASFQLRDNPRRTRSPTRKVRLREVKCLVHSHMRQMGQPSVFTRLCSPRPLQAACTALPSLDPPPPAPAMPTTGSSSTGPAPWRLRASLSSAPPPSHPPVQSSLHASLHPSRLGSPALSTAAQGSYHQRTHSTSGACLARTRVPRREGALPRKGAANTGPGGTRGGDGASARYGHRFERVWERPLCRGPTNLATCFCK